jgi:glycosyltransferase involved in cell wall biosynthesis
MVIKLADMIFSIVTPTFKQPKWVRLCAASVADQFGVNFEHIIQDGGDGRGLEWLEGMPTARLFVEHDLGMYDALAKGISKASGDIIGHLNSDEQYLPGTLKIVHEFFTRQPEVEILFGDAILVGADGTPFSYRRIVTPLRAHIARCHLGTLTCSAFFRRSVVERGLSYESDWKVVGDAALVLGWLDAGLKMATIRRPLAVFTFTGANKGREKVAKEEGMLFRGQGTQPCLAQSALVAAHHRIRKLLAGAYRKRDLSVEIFTLDSPERRQKIVANQVGFGWPTEA